MVQHLKHVPLSSLCFVCPCLPDRSHHRLFSLATFLKQFFLLCFEFPGILLQFCLCLCMYLRYSVQRSEDNIWESVLYFHYGGPRAQTQVLKLGHLYPLSHLASPDFLLLLLFCILMFSALFWEHFSVIHPQFSSGLLSQRQFCPYDEVGHV